MNFYSKLPKGPSPSTAAGGIKARYFNGKNASAAPVLFTILAIFGLGYTIDYQSASFALLMLLLLLLALGVRVLTGCVCLLPVGIFQCTSVSRVLPLCVCVVSCR